MPDYEILVPCGVCVACRKSMARDWRCRLLFELKDCIAKGQSCYFVTLTINDENYEFVRKNPEVPIRRYFELYRKRVGRSVKHFFVTELGKESGRLHYHGILFGSLLAVSDLSRLWRYGFSYYGYCSVRTASYITKYILKPQMLADWYIPRKFVSPGLGRAFVDSKLSEGYRVEPRGVPRFVCKIGGVVYPLPRYFKQKLYSKEYLESLKFDQLREYEKNGFGDLKLQGVPYSCVSDFLDARESVLRDSVARGMSSLLKKRGSVVDDLFPDPAFLEYFDYWDAPPITDVPAPF